MHVGYEAGFQHKGSYPDGVFMRRELDGCLRVESPGFDSIWLTEHHLGNYGLIPDPLAARSFFRGIPDSDGEQSLQYFVRHRLAELRSWPAEPSS